MTVVVPHCSMDIQEPARGCVTQTKDSWAGSATGTSRGAVTPRSVGLLLLLRGLCIDSMDKDAVSCHRFPATCDSIVPPSRSEQRGVFESQCIKHVPPRQTQQGRVSLLVLGVNWLTQRQQLQKRRPTAVVRIQR